LAPRREFLLAQTRDRDLATFMEMRDDVTVSSVGRSACIILLLHSVVDGKFAGVEIQVVN
jgi:flagellar biosynthesis protein FliP